MDIMSYIMGQQAAGGISKGGTKVQSDWNENDENSAAYIQNRPFYQEEGEKKEIEFTETDVENFQELGYLVFEKSLNLEIGDTIKIIINIILNKDGSGFTELDEPIVAETKVTNAITVDSSLDGFKLIEYFSEQTGIEFTCLLDCSLDFEPMPGFHCVFALGGPLIFDATKVVTAKIPTQFLPDIPEGSKKILYQYKSGDEEILQGAGVNPTLEQPISCSWENSNDPIEIGLVYEWIENDKLIQLLHRKFSGEQVRYCQVNFEETISNLIVTQQSHRNAHLLNNQGLEIVDMRSVSDATYSYVKLFLDGESLNKDNFYNSLTNEDSEIYLECLVLPIEIIKVQPAGGDT